VHGLGRRSIKSQARKMKKCYEESMALWRRGYWTEPTCSLICYYVLPKNYKQGASNQRVHISIINLKKIWITKLWPWWIYNCLGWSVGGLMNFTHARGWWKVPKSLTSYRKFTPELKDVLGTRNLWLIVMLLL